MAISGLWQIFVGLYGMADTMPMSKGYIIMVRCWNEIFLLKNKIYWLRRKMTYFVIFFLSPRWYFIKEIVSSLWDKMDLRAFYWQQEFFRSFMGPFSPKESLSNNILDVVTIKMGKTNTWKQNKICPFIFLFSTIPKKLLYSFTRNVWIPFKTLNSLHSLLLSIYGNVFNFPLDWNPFLSTASLKISFNMDYWNPFLSIEKIIIFS